MDVTCSSTNPPLLLMLLVFFIWLRTSALFNTTNIMHMPISVSRRLNILCIMFKIVAFFIIMLFTWLYVLVVILLTCGKHLHARIISLIGEVWAHKISLSPPFFIDVPVPSQESERSCICVLGVSILPLSTILRFDSPESVVFFFFFKFYSNRIKSSDLFYTGMNLHC